MSYVQSPDIWDVFNSYLLSERMRGWGLWGSKDWIPGQRDCALGGEVGAYSPAWREIWLPWEEET